MLKLLAACVIALGFLVSPAAAQPSKIFLASTGSDASDGSRGSPKRTLQAAHDAVATGGNLVILNTAGYGGLTIAKSIDISVPPGVSGFVTVSGSSNGITINAGASDTVAIRGLIIEGGGTTGTNGFGIYAASVGDLIVEDCIIRNFQKGVSLSSASSAHLAMRRGSVRNVGTGIDVEANAGANVDAVVTDVTVDHASSGAIFAKLMLRARSR